MANISKKLFGNLSLTGIKKALQAKPEAKTTYKEDEQIKVNGVEWEDGGISISINYKDANDEWQRINLGNLRVSTLDDAPKAAPAVSGNPFGDDSPF